MDDGTWSWLDYDDLTRVGQVGYGRLTREAEDEICCKFYRMFGHCVSLLDLRVDCGQCGIRLAPGLSRGQSLCDACVHRAWECGQLHRNHLGQWLDPIFKQPLPTCKCGKLCSVLSSWCVLEALSGSHDHELIRDHKPLTVSQ